MERENKLRLGIGMPVLLLLGLFTWLVGNVLADLPTPESSSPGSRDETAVLSVSQATGIPTERLSAVASFTLELPLAGKVLYREWVLDRGGQGQLLYELTLDESGEPLSQDGTEDVLWAAEAQAYRDSHEETVLRLTAQQRDVPVERLRLIHDVMRVYLHTGRSYWQVKVMDGESGRVYDLAIDAEGHPMDVKALQRAEFEALRARYGRLDPELHYLLETKDPADTVPVLIWIQEADHAEIDRRLVQEYPELKGLRVVEGRVTDGRGRPVELDRVLGKKIKTDYVAWLKQAHQAAAQPVVDFLRARGNDATALELFSGVAAELSQTAILELNDASLPNLGTIYWGGTEAAPQLDSAAPTIRAPIVWNRGYTGAGATEPITVAVAEGGIVRPNVTHGALAGKIIAANEDEPTDSHAARVASVLVGDHPSFPDFRGIAYGNNSVVSAKVVDGSYQYMESGLNWAVDQGAQVINCSFSTTSTLHIQPEDRIWDYVVRYRYPTIVVAAGNEDNTGNWNVRSPAKGYNILTVGGFDDNNTPTWSDDEMWWDESCHVDPYVDGQGTSGDREKPDVAAVGVHLMSADISLGDNGFSAPNGTSLAAPQVAGLAALIMDRVPTFASWPWWPEAIRAIIMASAMHNIEGDSRLSDWDGAGGIDVSLADSIAVNGQWATRNISYPIDYEWDDNYGDFVWLAETFPVSASAGVTVRAAIAWDSNPSSDFQTDGTDSLDTELDLLVFDPDGNEFAWSISYDNSFELVEFTATQTGQYTLKVFRNPVFSSEDFNFLGIAWIVQSRAYLPIIRKGGFGPDRASSPGGLFVSPISVPGSPFDSPITTPSPTSP